jgi:rhodanese-related sulfurtransferase
MSFQRPSIAPEVDISRLAEAMDEGAVVIDVRMPDEYLVVRVPGVRLIPLPELAARADEVPKGAQVFVICASGVRSLIAAEVLNNAGWDAVSVAGGTKAWVAQGRPVERGPAA